MAFDYKETGLPLKEKFQYAAQKCNEWLNTHMSIFGPERIKNFMHHQPVKAAKTILEKTESPSEASIIVALLGPAKFDLISEDGQNLSVELEKKSRSEWGDDVVNLVKHLSGVNLNTPEIIRDAERLFLVEGLSTMHDQLIGRRRIDPHHNVRWDILRDLEAKFPALKGKNPQIDVIFEDALKQSRDALETLDKKYPDKVKLLNNKKK
tara:strand:+ start:289 stop:912 length:624 start_codon:yes stop_codon:yes gene_type:complete